MPYFKTTAMHGFIWWFRRQRHTQKQGLEKKPTYTRSHGQYRKLAANLFRATQTEEKLRRGKIKGKQQANKTHYEIGKKVRKTIEEIGGTMPENLPASRQH
jgi:DNA-damage-inducible protein D